jgi:CO/xanthine dehydrogenase FAD-binding subunit
VAKVTVQDYLVPRSLAEAITLLERHGPELLVMAGGTVAMPLINEGISLPERVMSLRRAGLDGIERDGDILRIGATATLTQLLGQDDIPLLREAARNTASWSIRNMGTVGGNLFTPPPGGDVAVALLALDARVVIAGPSGERILSLADFYTGFMANALAAGELLVRIDVPVGPAETAYLKLGRKHANTPAVVTVAVALRRRDGLVDGARIALGAAGSHPVRATAAEAALTGRTLDPHVVERAAQAAARDCRPFTDALATEWYRRRMVGLFVRRALEQISRGGASA